MSEITNDVLTQIRDPKVLALARRVLHSVSAATARVTAHHADAARFPLPADGRAIEHVLNNRFRAMPADRQRRASERVTGILAQKTLRARWLGSAAGLDLRTSASVADLVRPKLVPADLGLTRAYIEGLRPVAARPETGFRPLQTLDKLELRIRSVRCIDETDPELFSSDTILMGATTVDESGDTKKVPSFKVGSFDDGKRKTYNPPKQLTMFSVLEGTAWPKSYFVTVVIAEQDNGGFPTFLQELYEGVKEEVIAGLAAAIGGAIGASGGPIGFVIGTVLGWVVGELFNLFKSWWEDDEFPPVTLRCNHAGINARWAGGATTSPEGRAWWKAHGGYYEMFYDWRLYH